MHYFGVPDTCELEEEKYSKNDDLPQLPQRFQDNLTCYIFSLQWYKLRVNMRWSGVNI